MKNFPKLICVFVLLILGSVTTIAQGFPWQDFKPHTLKELSDMEKDVEQARSEDGKPGVVFHGDMMLTKARVVYTGETRPISELKKQFLAKWAEMFTQDKDAYASLYETDLLFTENGVEYWLPVQKKVIPYFDKELKKGDKVDLYIVRGGGLFMRRRTIYKEEMGLATICRGISET